MVFESVFSVITMISVTAVFAFYFSVKKKEGKDWVYAIYFITVLATGTVLFSLALWYKNDSDTVFSPLFIFAKAVALALKSFGGDFNAAVLARLAEDNKLFAVASFMHFTAAVILTFLIAIKLFGKNAVNRLRVFLNSRRAKYIVVGASGQAGIFLKNFDNKKRRRTTVVIESGRKDYKKELMFKGFSVVVIKDDKDAHSRKDTPNAKKDITKETFDALKTAGFDRNKYGTKIIAMSEDDEVNLLVAKIVTDYIAHNVQPSKGKKGRINKLTAEQEAILEKIRLSAHIMYESLDRSEHFAFAEYALGRVRFFNPYEVRARKFISENPITSFIPKEWINTKKARLYNQADGRLRPYRIGNFFIGYGFTNSQILKKSICNYQLLGTDYNALIIDKDAKKLEKQFKNCAPGLFAQKDGEGKEISGAELKPNPDGNVYFPSPEEKYNIEFVDLNVLSADFYARIINEIEGGSRKAGYDFASVIIALGSDKLSIETALELRQKLYERRLLKGKAGEREYDRVRIYVKILKDSVLSDYKLLNDINDIESEITVFGASDEILTEDYIVLEKLDKVAKRIANDYWKTATCGTENAGAQTTNIVTKWDSLTEFKRDSNRNAALSIRTKLNLLGFELDKGEGGTDPEILKEYREVYGAGVSQRQRTEKDGGKFVDFVERDGGGAIIDNARNNLARMEHQRWNTLHLLNGWTKLAKAEVASGMRQDEKAKQHACITTFEGLTDLRALQAKAAVAEAVNNNQTLTEDKALSDADTVCYDFDVMDYLPLNCGAFSMKIVKNI